MPERNPASEIRTDPASVRLIADMLSDHERFVIEVEENGEWRRAGSMGFDLANERNRIANLGGLAVHPDYRGRKLADAAARAFQRHLLLDLDFHRLQLEIYGFNERAIQHAERSGFVREGVKRKAYRRPEQQKWYAGETISLGIGQGYNNFTMLQLAHAMATLANGGTKHTPHLTLARRNPLSGQREVPERPESQALGYKPEHVRVVLDAMQAVTTEGTSARKTGPTAAPPMRVGKPPEATHAPPRQAWAAARLECSELRR